MTRLKDNSSPVEVHSYVMAEASKAASTEDLIRDALQPHFNRLVTQFRADVELLGERVAGPEIDLLTASEDERLAYVRLSNFASPYMTYRATWTALRTAGQAVAITNDPLGLDSPLAEVANLPDLLPNWRDFGSGVGPWAGGELHIKLAWIVSHGGVLWVPTAQEQNEAWARCGVKAA